MAFRRGKVASKGPVRQATANRMGDSRQIAVKIAAIFFRFWFCEEVVRRVCPICFAFGISLFRWISRTGFRGDAVTNWLESRLVVAVLPSWRWIFELEPIVMSHNGRKAPAAGDGTAGRRARDDARGVPTSPRGRATRRTPRRRRRCRPETRRDVGPTRHQSRTTRRQRPRRGCRQAYRVDDGRRRSAARGLAARGRHRRDEPRGRVGPDRGRRRRRGGRRLGAPRRRRPSPSARRGESRDVDGRGEPRRPRHLLLRRRRRRPAGRPERGTRGRRRSLAGPAPEQTPAVPEPSRSIQRRCVRRRPTNARRAARRRRPNDGPRERRLRGGREVRGRAGERRSVDGRRDGGRESRAARVEENRRRRHRGGGPARGPIQRRGFDPDPARGETRTTRPRRQRPGARTRRAEQQPVVGRGHRRRAVPGGAAKVQVKATRVRRQKERATTRRETQEPGVVPPEQPVRQARVPRGPREGRGARAPEASTRRRRRVVVRG